MTSVPFNRSSDNQIRFVEELSMTALPALQTVYYDGWVLRFADGYTRRANSVNPIYDSTLGLDKKLKQVERLYNERKQPTVFKMTPMSYPVDLDHVLEYHHYREEPGASVQICDLTQHEKSDSEAATMISTLSGEWLMAYFRLNGTMDRFLPVMRQILTNIVPQRCFASIVQNQEIVALGLGVLDQGYLGLYDIVTRDDLRNQGIGKQLVSNLLNWGKDNGAESAYLQVRPDNEPALHLYESLGFTESYQYWYRTKA